MQKETANPGKPIKCNLCNYTGHSLLEHLPSIHNISTEDYLKQYVGAPTISRAFYDRLILLKKERPQIKQPKAIFQIGRIPFEVHTEVPPEVCLPLPEHYRFPQFGKLKKDIQHAAVSLSSGRSIYISGISGSGKDAFIHALSFYTRRPSIAFQIQPGADISHWLFARAFNNEGTYWEEGKLLQCLRDGYTTSSGKRVPYLVLISDLDRADKSQVESLRLILDSIQKRVKGPGGVTYPVLEGTQIVSTANTTGGGDNRGHYISANPLDSSIISRFEAGFEFHWLNWKDEEVIIKSKFPHLAEKKPECFSTMKTIVETLRTAIQKEELFCDFSHRDLCSWLQHAEDLLLKLPAVPKLLLKKSQRAWTDRLPDPETKLEALRIIDALIDGGSI